MQQTEQSEKPSQQVPEPSMRDMLHTILGEVQETRAIMERLEERMTSMEERMTSMEGKLAM